MKSVSWNLSLMAAVSCFALFGSTTAVLAADDNPANADERLQRLERHVSELADQQQQIMRRLDAPEMGRGPMGAPGAGRFRPTMAQMGPDSPRPMRGHPLGGLICLICLGCLICNILLAVWIASDIRKRGEGSGIFIALALVAGIPAAIIYSLVRIGDKISASPPAPPK
jgi:hypothetical protein